MTTETETRTLWAVTKLDPIGTRILAHANHGRNHYHR